MKADSAFSSVHGLVGDLELHTVCRSAKCPNMHECWGHGTATLMLLGNECTRACRFCAIPAGRPKKLDLDEPRRAAEAAVRMKLNHVVLTSVARDDLPDGGSGVFADTIRAIRERLPQASIEVLTPDFQGDENRSDPRAGSAAGCVQSQPGDGEPPAAGDPAPGLLWAVFEGAAVCFILAAGSGGEVRADGRVGRNGRRAAPVHPAIFLPTECVCLPWVSIFNLRACTGRWTATWSQRCLKRWRNLPKDSASKGWPPGPWCGPPTRPMSCCVRPARARPPPSSRLPCPATAHIVWPPC
jgi:hypothetical protein